MNKINSTINSCGDVTPDFDEQKRRHVCSEQLVLGINAKKIEIENDRVGDHTSMGAKLI
jgi:hypothetical protein